MSLRLVFMGTPDFSVPVLSSLIKAGHEICAVYTQPPRKSGRGQKLRKSPVHQLAEQHDITVFTPATLKNEDEQRKFATHKADACVVVAYGQLLPPAILEAPTHGCFNVHASLLPRWRGAAPIHRAIMAGDRQTGVSIMQMEQGLDTGPVCLMANTPINDQTTTAQLHDELSHLGAKLMVETLSDLQNDKLTFTPQADQGVTYAKKIDKTEARIDFNLHASMVLRHIHGLSPFPGAWLELPIDAKPTRVKILNAQITDQPGAAGTILDENLTIACANKSIHPIRLQREGKSALDLADFVKGTHITPGTVI